MTDANILIVDDNAGVLSAGKLLLKRHFGQVETLRDPEGIPEAMRHTRFDVILLDMNFSGGKNTGREGFNWLERILEADPEAVVVLITAYGDVELAVRAIKAGATDFVLKPWDNEKLMATLNAALRLRHSREENHSLKERQQARNMAELNELPPMLGDSPAMRQVTATIERIAPTDANVLLLGENGSGKDLAAQLIHARSNRAQANFIKTDLGALSESLFESELFGHVKGAFTDAREDKPGRFELADGGVIFLDEIANLTMAQQARLLSVLQDRKTTRVGSAQARPVDVRVICATNQDLYALVQQRAFRQDLLYRINTIEIRLPPLRERIDDIALLAEHFLRQFAAKYGRPAAGFSAALLREMKRYHWPGNIRELQHAVERAVIMSTGDKLEPEDFFFRPAAAGETLPDGLQIEEAEKQLIVKALGKHHGNITEAARELGLTRASLYRRIEKYKL
jgi:DNA-binding NtrC family response regulator